MLWWYEKTTSLTSGDKSIAYLKGKPRGDSSMLLKLAPPSGRTSKMSERRDKQLSLNTTKLAHSGQNISTDERAIHLP
jgi:hypothetical protein